MQKLVTVAVAVFIVAGGGGFFGGMQYAKGKATTSTSQLQQFRGGAGGPGTGAFRRNRAGQGGEFVSGEVISKDDTSITVKLRDGGSKIVFFSGSTTIGKMTEATAADLEVGKQVTVNGSANSDGSISAQGIQVRPMMSPPTTPGGSREQQLP